jgi:hypothetical protein
MDAAQRFEEYRAKFLTTDLWRAMVNECEGTGWHREANVGVHTDMLLDWYRTNLMQHRSDAQRIYTMVACLFHDVAKPPSRIVKIGEDGQPKNGYHGHEPRSARMWVQYAVENAADTEQILQFDIYDVRNVAYMIEHHVPFAMKKVAKRTALKKGFYERMGEPGHRAWLDLLLSDQHGRLSDDKENKLKIVDEWMTEWEKVQYA